ncbi:MAG: SCO family protein [Psychrobium sp.]|nr:SCO family protein [Psychrobium sp.]
MMRTKIILIVLSLLAVTLGVIFNSYDSEKSAVIISNTTTAPPSLIVTSEHYRAFVPAKSIADFSLQRNNNQTFSQQNLKNKWSFVLLGYASCPDVCPTTLTRLKAVYKDLTSISDVQVLFVSVDPLRDDISRLSQYVGFFDKSFIALSNSHDKLFPFSQNLYLPYGIVAIKTDDNYGVSHSGAIALLNPQGLLHGQFKPVHTLGEVPSVDMKMMATEFKNIVAAYDKMML